MMAAVVGLYLQSSNTSKSLSVTLYLYLFLPLPLSLYMSLFCCLPSDTCFVCLSAFPCDVTLMLICSFTSFQREEVCWVHLFACLCSAARWSSLQCTR